jgi:hypothetical protein
MLRQIRLRDVVARMLFCLCALGGIIYIIFYYWPLFLSTKGHYYGCKYRDTKVRATEFFVLIVGIY